jgi:orotate phosphoribosyltransferase-like protein
MELKFSFALIVLVKAASLCVAVLAIIGTANNRVDATVGLSMVMVALAAMALCSLQDSFVIYRLICRQEEAVSHMEPAAEANDTGSSDARKQSQIE